MITNEEFLSGGGVWYTDEVSVQMSYLHYLPRTKHAYTDNIHVFGSYYYHTTEREAQLYQLQIQIGVMADHDN